jgi:Na+-driven multidrug efflux pump
MGIVAQSICLACLDTKTPAVAVAAASVINVIGDIYLVRQLKMGIKGAAIATAAASLASTGILLMAVARKMKNWRRSAGVNGKPKLTKVIDGTPVMLANMNGTDTSSTQEAPAPAAIPLVSFPNRSSFLKLLKLAGPIFFILVAKIVCYSAMTLRTTDFGITALASHNIMMRIFFFYATFGDSLNQASQTFVPQVLLQNRKKATMAEKKKEKRTVKKLITRLAVMATFIGLFDTKISRWILCNSGSYLTKEPAILKHMSEHSLFLSLSLLLHPFIMLFEGAILATQDLTFLVTNYVMTMLLLFGQLKFVTREFAGVWRALFVFQSIRLAQFSTRVWRKTVRHEGEDDNDEIVEATSPAAAAS